MSSHGNNLLTQGSINGLSNLELTNLTTDIMESNNIISDNIDSNFFSIEKIEAQNVTVDYELELSETGFVTIGKDTVNEITITDTQIGYLDGISSNIQEQLNTVDTDTSEITASIVEIEKITNRFSLSATEMTLNTGYRDLIFEPEDGFIIWKTSEIQFGFGSPCTINLNGQLQNKAFQDVDYNKIYSNEANISTLQSEMNSIEPDVATLQTQMIDVVKVTDRFNVTNYEMDLNTGHRDLTFNCGDGYIIWDTTEIQFGYSSSCVLNLNGQLQNKAFRDTDFNKIYSNATNISTLQSEMNSVEADVLQLESDVSQNDSDISQLILDVSQNENDITQNASDITQNVSDINQLILDVSQNESDINQLILDVSQNESDISQLVLDVSQNESDISQLVLDVSQNESDIASNLSNFNLLAIDVGENKQLSEANEVSINNLDEIIRDYNADTLEIRANDKNILINTHKISDDYIHLNANEVRIQHHLKINGEDQNHAYTDVDYNAMINFKNRVIIPNFDVAVPWDLVGRTTQFANGTVYNSNSIMFINPMSQLIPYVNTTAPYVWNYGTKFIRVKYTVNFKSYGSLIIAFKTQIRNYQSASSTYNSSLFCGQDLDSGMNFQNYVNYSDDFICEIKNGDTLSLKTIYHLATEHGRDFDLDVQLSIIEV